MKYSFIVACYNSHSTIRKCLDSILNQTFADYECIMFNDGSTDDTAQILLEYSNRDARFKYFYQKNKGTSKTTNECIKVATGHYIVPIDHDDYIEPNLLDCMENILHKQDMDLIGFEYDFYPQNKQKVVNDGSLLTPNNYEEKMDISFYKSHLFLTHTSTCIKRELLERVYFDGDGYGADTVVMQILIHKAKKLCQLNKVLYHRLMNYDSVSNKGDRRPDNLFSIAERSVKQLYFFKKDKARNAFELHKVFPWYMSGLITMPRHKISTNMRIIKTGWRIFLNRKIVLQNDDMTSLKYIWLLFGFIPVKPKTR